MNSLDEIIREQFDDSVPFDADSIAKETWRRIEHAPDLGDILASLLRGEVVRLRREGNRAIGHAWTAEVLASMPAPKIPKTRYVNPWETIEAARASMAPAFRQMLREYELQVGRRTVPLREATEADIDEKLEAERARLAGLYQSVQLYERLKSYFSLGITTLGELL